MSCCQVSKKPRPQDVKSSASHATDSSKRVVMLTAVRTLRVKMDCNRHLPNSTAISWVSKWKEGLLTTRRPGDQATRRPGDQATRRAEMNDRNRWTSVIIVHKAGWKETMPLPSSDLRRCKKIAIIFYPATTVGSVWHCTKLPRKSDAKRIWDHFLVQWTQETDIDLNWLIARYISQSRALYDCNIGSWSHVFNSEHNTMLKSSNCQFLDEELRLEGIFKTIKAPSEWREGDGVLAPVTTKTKVHESRSQITRTKVMN